MRLCECAVGRIADSKRFEVWRDGLPEVWPGSEPLTRAAGWSAGAGYPLVIDDRVVGVVIMLLRNELSDAALDMLASITETSAARRPRFDTDATGSSAAVVSAVG